MIAHNVYFTLRDPSESNEAELVADCHKYLSSIPGMLFYAAGTLSDYSRPVNDRDYDVALHTVFEDSTTLDAYLTAPAHLEFVEKNKPNWAQIRVFDSVVEKG